MEKEIESVPVNNLVFELSKQGHVLFKAKRYDEARASFEEALLIEPENPYLLTGIGDLLRSQKKFSGAAEYYRHVLTFDPYNIYSLLGLGDALRGLQQFHEAIEVWKTYLRHHQSDNIYVLTRIADSYKRHKDYDLALTYYQKASAVKPNDRYVLLGLADLYKTKGHDLLALEHYEKAVAGGVTTISILTIVGNLHLKHNNYEIYDPEKPLGP